MIAFSVPCADLPRLLKGVEQANSRAGARNKTRRRPIWQPIKLKTVQNGEIVACTCTQDRTKILYQELLCLIQDLAL
jgi:hypothetical protein